MQKHMNSGWAEANFRWGYPSKYQKFDFEKLMFIFELLLYKTQTDIILNFWNVRQH